MKREGEGTNTNRFPLPLFFFFCGADDGSRTRCLHLGMVCPLVSVWCASRERACLREAGWWVGDVEVVTFVQELFGL